MSIAPMKYAERTALGQPLIDEDHDLLVDAYRGFTPAGTFISPYSAVISYLAPDYFATNAYQILLTDTNLDDLMTAVLAAGYTNIYIKTDGATFTWNTDAVPANLLIEADLPECFVMKHSTPDTVGAYIAVGANTMLINVCSWDYGGVSSGYPTPNGPRPCAYYWNATQSTVNLSNYYRQVLLADISWIGGDIPGIAINNYGVGDNYYCGVKSAGIGFNCQVNSGDAAGVGIGVASTLGGAGKALYLNSEAAATGILAYILRQANIIGLQIDSTVATTDDIVIDGHHKTAGQMIALFHNVSTFAGNGLTFNYASGSGSFTGNFFSALVNTAQRAWLDYAGHFNVRPATDSETCYATWNAAEANARMQIGHDGLRIGPGSTGFDSALVRIGVATLGCYADLVSYTDNIYGLGTSAQHWKAVYSNKYYANDNTEGKTENVAVAKVGGGTRTLAFINGLYTGYTDS